MSTRAAQGEGLRVLALVSDGFGAHGGIAAYNRELLTALDAAPGIGAVHVLARHGPAPAPGRIHQERPRPGRVAFAAAALARGVQAPWDWVFCGHLHMAALARVVAAAAGARLWLQLHGLEAWRPPGPTGRAAAHAAALVTAVSRVTRERFLSWCHVHPSRVRVLSNTYDPTLAALPPDPGLRDDLAPGGAPVLLTVSRLDPRERYKGHEQVMRALPLLRGRSGREARYVIAGVGDDRPRLEACARELGVAHRVRFTGALDRARLAALYQAADVFVMPSTGEGFGIVYLEAAACGLPVVAGDRDGARDALRDGLVGRLVDPGDPAAIAAAVDAALAERRAPSGFQVFARERFREHLQRVLHAAVPAGPGERVA